MPGKLRSRQSSLPSAVRHLSLGGALSAIGDAAYSYVPPIKMPVLNIRKAAPIDVAAAWDAADTEGAAAGSKFMDGLNASMKEGMKDVKMGAFRYGEIEKAHQEFAKQVAEQSSSDPAFFASTSNQNKLREMSARLIDKTKINAYANEYKLFEEQQKNMQQLGRQGDVVMMNGLPTDYTQQDFYTDFLTEQSPAKMRQLFRKRYAKAADGNIYETGEAPFKADAINHMTGPDAEAEVTTLQKFIHPDSKETGGTSFHGSVTPGVQALYKLSGGDATGYRTTDNTSKQTTNLKMINALRQKFNADPSAWRQYVSPDAQQVLLAQHYRNIAAENGGTGAGQVINGAKGKAVLDAGNGLKIDLSGNHLEVRRRLSEASADPKLDAQQQQKIDEAYKKLYAHDLQAAEVSVSNWMRQRLSLGGYTETSDVSRSTQHDQGLTPPAASGSDKGLDLHGMIAYGEGNWRSDIGKSDGKSTLPLWSLNVTGNADYDAMVTRLSKNDDGTARSVGELARNGMTIYNAKTLEGIAWGNNGDATLDKIKVLPGSGIITLLPKDPTKFSRKTAEVAAMEQEAKTIQAAINKLEIAKSKRALTPTELKEADLWQQRQKQTIQMATTKGYVAAIKMRAVANQSDITNIPGYMRSVKNIPDFKEKAVNSATYFRDLNDDESNSTGLRSITLDEGKAAGLKDGWGPTDYVGFDVYVGHENIQALGSRESVKENNAINTKVNTREAQEKGNQIQNRYGN